jgi:group II intron reverse transcriptase/maturase
MENRQFDTASRLSVKPSLTSDERVRVFQRKLYLKAKQEPGFRAHSLYDKVSDYRLLEEAYHRVRTGKYSSSPGVDGLTFEKIEQYGKEEFLLLLQGELRCKGYRAQAVRRVYIPKNNSGELRPLGIPTIRDRVVQMAVKMVIEPLFEAEFIETSYGFRPKKNAQQAIKAIRDNIHAGYKFVLDADLKKYFDTIPHDKLTKVLQERLCDGSILKLINGWLKAPIRHPDGRMEKSTVGSPQGGVISPLLANIYLHVFDRLITTAGSVYHQSNIRIVRYADDFVLMGQTHYDKRILARIRETLSRMGLTLNETKTRLLHTNKSSVYFLGFEFRWIRSKFQWRKGWYTDIRPSIASRSKLFTAIREMLRTRGHWTIEWMVYKLNEVLRGWLNYFVIPKVSYLSDTAKTVCYYVKYKLYKWLKGKGRQAHRTLRQRPYEILVRHKGLLDIERYVRMKTSLVNAKG